MKFVKIKMLKETIYHTQKTNLHRNTKVHFISFPLVLLKGCVNSPALVKI